MRKLILAILAAGAGMTVPVEAANTSGSFSVTVNLTAACSLGAINSITFNVTSFGAVAALGATEGEFQLTCTNTLGYTFGLTASPGPAAVPGLASINVNDVGISYTLNAPAASAGDGTAKTHKIGTVIAAGQGGTCATATCTSTLTHYLTVNF